MEAALGWIGAIFEWFGQFFPRWDLVRANEQAVKYLPGGRTKVLDPGIYWYWPVTTEVVVHPVCRQVLDSQPQTLMTKDNKPVYVAGIVIYKITDLHTYLVENYDAEANLDDILQTAVRKAVVARDFDKIQEGRADMDNVLTREAQKALADFGVEVEAARLTDFSLARVANIVGNGLMNMHLNANND